MNPLARPSAFAAALFVLASFAHAQCTSQTNRLVPAAPISGDAFGVSVALTDDLAVVGAPLAAPSGRAIVYRRESGGWVFEAELTPPDGADGDDFGRSVAISEDRIAIGAPSCDGIEAESGAVYVFRRTAPGSWQFEQKLEPDPLESEGLGWSLSMAGTRIIAGAPTASDLATFAGAAYIFTRTGSAWSLESRLVDTDRDPFEFFGESVAIDGDRALVGAKADNSAGDEIGSASAFTFDGIGWQREDRFVGSDCELGAGFGSSVAMKADLAVIGAPGDFRTGPSAGVAYVFQRTPSGAWTELAALEPADPIESQQFAWSVALDGNRALIGSAAEPDGVSPVRAAYVFAPLSGLWTQVDRIVATPTLDAEVFSFKLAIARRFALVGALRKAGTGSAYTFDVGSCAGCPSDVNQDGFADAIDYDQFIALFLSGDPAGDYNRDGFTDAIDYDRFISDFLSGC